MNANVTLHPISKKTLPDAQSIIAERHYLHTPVDPRCSVEGYNIHYGDLWAGIFLLGRPEATKVNGWYGSVEDVETGACEVTRWQVLNLARVYLSPEFQPGGFYHNMRFTPGFTDRKGQFRSTLASIAIKDLSARVGYDYLTRRPPCFLDEPYEIKWLLSYCNTNLHRGTIYKAAGFELYRTNENGIQTWRLPLPPLTLREHTAIQEMSIRDPRAQAYRAQRAQLKMEL